MQIFSFQKKKELEQYCRGLVVNGGDFASLIFSCELRREPFIHGISYRDIIPEHLWLSDSDHKALGANAPGELSPVRSR